MMTPNKSPEPTAGGALSSAIAVHVIWSRVPELWSLSKGFRIFP